MRLGPDIYEGSSNSAFGSTVFEATASGTRERLSRCSGVLAKRVSFVVLA